MAAKLAPPKTRQQGEAAVEREIKSLFREASQTLIDDIGAEHGIRNIDTFITKKDGSKLRLKWDRIDPTGSRIPELHRQYRNKRGHVPKDNTRGGRDTWRARVIVPFGATASYIREMKQHVGRWKASWAQTAMRLGANDIPAWLKRHMPSPKSLLDTSSLSNDGATSITFGSRAPGIESQRSFIGDAVRARTEAIRKRISLIVNGYSRDLVNGMRISNKAKRDSRT